MPGIKDVLSKWFTGSGSELVKSITGLVDISKFSAEEKAEHELKVSQVVNDYNLKAMELTNAEFELKLKEKEMENQARVAELQDVANARLMQIEALKQGDNFSKRFIYFMAAGLILITATFDFCFFKIQYPERNHDIINMIAGVLNTVCLGTIVSFFFGSSKGSEDKQKQLDKMMER